MLTNPETRESLEQSLYRLAAYVLAVTAGLPQ